MTSLHGQFLPPGHNVTMRLSLFFMHVFSFLFFMHMSCFLFFMHVFCFCVVLLHAYSEAKHKRQVASVPGLCRLKTRCMPCIHIPDSGSVAHVTTAHSNASCICAWFLLIEKLTRNMHHAMTAHPNAQVAAVPGSCRLGAVVCAFVRSLASWMYTRHHDRWPAPTFPRSNRLF